MIILTAFSPKDKVYLFDGIVLIPKSRASTKLGNGTMYHDAIAVESFKNSDALKNWVIFHTFILNSRHTAQQYETAIDSNDPAILNQPLANQIDYDHILPHVYFFDNEQYIGDKDVSYADLYRIYIEQPSENIALVKNYLNDFGTMAGGVRRLNRSISDPTYWQMMVYYSIVENFIGQPDFCPEQHECSTCKKEHIQHRPVSQAKWLRQRLEELMPGQKAMKTYEAVIYAVRQKIRHDTVHSAIIPTAEEFSKTEPGVTVYDLKRSIGDYEKDHHALDSLLYMLADVSRYLLLDRVFNLQIYPEPRPLNVLTLDNSGVAMKAG